MNIFWAILMLLGGMVLLVKGADWFVDGASNIAKALKIPSLVIGLTLVSMGTSAPEAAVSITSAIQRMSDMSIGNVVGSNIFNTLFILGVSALFIPLAVNREIKIYDIPVMLGTYLILILFAFVVTPGRLDLLEGIVMLLLFVGYITFLILRTKKANQGLGALSENAETPTEPEKKMPMWKSILFAVLGLAGIVGGGTLSVDGAEYIALKLGMSEALVGLTILAVGTSLPELVTSVVASIKKENDIAIGNVVGSNIFNVIFILGLSSVISPLAVAGMDSLIDMLVMFGSGVLLFLVAFCGKKIYKWQGVIGVLLYVGYLAYIIARNYA